MTHLEILKGCLDVIQAKIDVDGEYLETEDLSNLSTLRYQLFMWITTEQRAEYVKSLKEFVKYMDGSFPGTDEENDEAWDKFYATDFVVTFGDKTVTLYNGADTFSDIQSMLNREIEEHEEL